MFHFNPLAAIFIEKKFRQLHAGKMGLLAKRCLIFFDN
jgi:hypothetical protein